MDISCLSKPAVWEGPACRDQENAILEYQDYHMLVVSV